MNTWGTTKPGCRLSFHEPHQGDLLKHTDHATLPGWSIHRRHCFVRSLWRLTFTDEVVTMVATFICNGSHNNRCPALCPPWRTITQKHFRLAPFFKNHHFEFKPPMHLHLTPSRTHHSLSNPLEHFRLAPSFKTHHSESHSPPPRIANHHTGPLPASLIL